MFYAFRVDYKITAASALAVTASVAVISWYKRRRHQTDAVAPVPSGAEESVYESSSYLNMFILFHYGRPSDVIRWDYGPTSALEFPRRCAELCTQHSPTKSDTKPYRALDVGCGVGGITFELAHSFDEVIGIDYSRSFVETCQTIRDRGSLEYSIIKHGAMLTRLTAAVDPDLDRTKVRFIRGDACDLPLDLGQFDCVLAANLLDRLHTPRAFLDRLTDIVAPGGVLVITCPYTFTTEFTPRRNWIGGWVTENGEEYSGFDGLRDHLSSHFDLITTDELPFFMRETERQYWLNVAQATVWRRRH